MVQGLPESEHVDGGSVTLSLTWIQLMRAPSPRSGLTTTCESWAPAVAEWKKTVAVKRGWSVPPAKPPSVAPGSPASSVSEGENVWSPKEPLVKKLDMRKLCVPVFARALDTA